jgi:hypothetical protein
MSSNRKSAPQRSVVEIIKTGEWSKVQYIHKLDCGHKEIRKRAASTKKIACLDCVKAGLAESILSSLARPAIVDPPIEAPWIDDIAEDIAQTEQEIGFIRAGLANALLISPETIDVVMEDEGDGMKLSYVMVYLDPENAKRIAFPQNSVFDI